MNEWILRLSVLFAHDNIDADLNKTAVADGSRSKSFHGTIAVAQQALHLPPIKTVERYMPLPNSIKKGSDMLQCSEKHLKSAQGLLVGIVAAFGENLLSRSIEKGTTIGHILKRCLKGHLSGIPARIEHSCFFDLPSNNTSTCRKVLEEYIRTLRPRTGEGSPDYIIAAADMRLYDRSWNLVYGNVSPGQRNEEFDAIVPIPGGMHFFICACTTS